MRVIPHEGQMRDRVNQSGTVLPGLRSRARDPEPLTLQDQQSGIRCVLNDERRGSGSRLRGDDSVEGPALYSADDPGSPAPSGRTAL